MKSNRLVGWVGMILCGLAAAVSGYMALTAYQIIASGHAGSEAPGLIVAVGTPICVLSLLTLIAFTFILKGKALGYRAVALICLIVGAAAFFVRLSLLSIAAALLTIFFERQYKKQRAVIREPESLNNP